MSKRKIVYLYEAARYQDKSVVDFYVKKFLQENPTIENTVEPNEGNPEGNSFVDSLDDWIGFLADHKINFTDSIQPDSTQSFPANASQADHVIAAIRNDYQVIHQELHTVLQHLNDEWPSAIDKLSEEFVNNLPSPLDSILDEQTKSKINFMQDKNFTEQLKALEKKMRDNIKVQLCARMPTGEALQKIPQLRAEFDAEVRNQEKLGHSVHEARQTAINKVIDPMQQLNISIILAGNFFSFLQDAKKLFKEFFGKEMF